MWFTAYIPQMGDFRTFEVSAWVLELTAPIWDLLGYPDLWSSATRQYLNTSGFGCLVSKGLLGSSVNKYMFLDTRMD